MQACNLLYNWDEMLPVDPTVFCRNCNVSVKYDKNSHINYETNTIYISKDLDIKTQRFLVAYYLNNLFNGDQDDCIKFALELLMPEHIFIQYMFKYNNIEKLSEIFDVPKCCIEARYYQLKRYFIL